MRKAHLRDAVALAQTLHWIETEVSPACHKQQTNAGDKTPVHQHECSSRLLPSQVSFLSAAPASAVLHSLLMDVHTFLSDATCQKDAQFLLGARATTEFLDDTIFRFLRQVLLRLQVGQNGKTITEVQVDEYLTGKRAQQQGFIETSFPTIAGAGPNGAIIHYRAEPSSCSTVDNKTLLLIDSGEGINSGQRRRSRCCLHDSLTRALPFARLCRGN